jgi:hypothetical protein
MPSTEGQVESKLQKGKQSKRLRSVRLKRRTINVGLESLENTASEMMHPSLGVASSLDHLYWTIRILLQQLPLISLQKNENKNKTEDHVQCGGKEISMLVFNPCIMVFLPLFGVIMLCLTIMNRRQ